MGKLVYNGDGAYSKTLYSSLMLLSGKMTLKAIKVSEENYHWLSGMAGNFQKMKGRPVSIDEAISSLRSRDLSDLAGTWTMTDKEATQFEKNMREGWKKWKLKSV